MLLDKMKVLTDLEYEFAKNGLTEHFYSHLKESLFQNQ